MNGRDKKWAEQRWNKLQRKIRQRDRLDQDFAKQKRIEQAVKSFKTTGQGGDANAS